MMLADRPSGSVDGAQDVLFDRASKIHGAGFSPLPNVMLVIFVDAAFLRPRHLLYSILAPNLPPARDVYRVFRCHGRLSEVGSQD